MKNSIVAGSLARKLVNELARKPHSVASVVHRAKHDLWLNARYCTVKGKLSGGVVVWAFTDAPAYSSQRIEKRKRLKDDLRLYSHAADLAETVRQKRADPIIVLREVLYKLAESKELPDELPRESSAYDEMNDEEMGFWFKWLNQQPDKASHPSRGLR